MIHVKSVLERATPLGAAATLLLAAAVPALVLSQQASAAALSERSLMVSSTVANNDVTAPDGTTYTGLTAGDPRNGQEVSHEYSFKVGTTGVIKGFTIEYCETAFGFMGSGACSAANLLNGGSNGFSASAWDTATVTIAGANFTVEANAANYLTFTSAAGTASIPAGTVVTIDLPATGSNYFVNPNTAYKATSNGTYFAHISTFADDTVAGDAFTELGDTPPGIVDDGTVTNNITTAIGLYTRVQETLNFSVEGEGGVGDATSGAPTASGVGCAPLTESGQLKMGDTNNALATDTAYKATSYFRLSTNSAYGTNVYYSGDTLKSPNHTMAAIANAGAASTVGTEQFGLGINAGPNTTFNSLTAQGAYGDAAGDNFAFDTASVTAPRVIASSTPPSGGVNCDTGQVDYVANISPDTPAGIYQTKINYIASPSY